LNDTLSMLRFRVFLLCALVCSCHRPTPVQEHRVTDRKRLAELRKLFVPEAYIRPEDQEKAQRLSDGYSAPFPCSYDKVELGTHVIASLPTDQCFKMTTPQRMRGLWRNDFEGQAFCAAPARECPAGKWKPKEPGVAWIDFASSLPGSADTPPGGLYEIDFVGRETAYPGLYGEYGFYNHEVVVDRLFSITEVEAPPPQPNKDEMIKDLKECEKAKTCVPNWNEINEMDEAQMKKAHIVAYLKDCAGKQICMPNSEVSSPR
jgi:hypothetical protein